MVHKYFAIAVDKSIIGQNPIKESISKLVVILLTEYEKYIDIWLVKQLILRLALNFLLEKGNEEEEITDDGGVD
jgi:hypothetical protein